MGTVLLAEWPRITSWRDKLEAWLLLCAEREGLAEEAECLRYLAGHLAGAPDIVRALLGRQPDATEFESLLLLGAVESAAARITCNATVGLMLSRSVIGRVVCTVAIPGTMTEVTFEARSETLARIGAVMKAVVELLADSSSTSEDRRHFGQ